MKPEDVRELVVLRMQESEESLQDARLLLSGNRGARTVVNRAYYAAFYSVLALLQTIGEIPRKHQGAIAAFDRLFVKTNRLPVQCTKYLHRLFEMRLEDDYERVEPIPITEAIAALDMAEQFVKEVRGYLTRQGYLSAPTS